MSPQQGDRQGAELRVLTLNTHKGLAAWNRRFMLSELREAARSTAADLLLLQEVIGERRSRAGQAAEPPHYEYLADSLWPDFAYGRNAATSGGHHGNAVLSRHRLRTWHNHDISVGGERRGLLHCVVGPAGDVELHVICVHLGLREADRAVQLGLLCETVNRVVPASAALLVAGDFNNWRGRADAPLRRHCRLHSAFALIGARAPKTFPARFPLLRLDRIYVRGLQVRSACVLSAGPWPHLSDHLPLLAEVVA
jgi:endonuclease/exonuclease/phosphatase family metal-dependent hydrolase